MNSFDKYQTRRHMGMVFYNFGKFIHFRHPNEIYQADIAAFIRHMTDRELSLNTIRGFISTLHAFFRWMLLKEVIDHNPVTPHMKARAKGRSYCSVPHPLEDEDIAKILPHLRTDRERKLITLLLAIPAKQKDLSPLTKEAFNLETLEVTIRSDWTIPFPVGLVPFIEALPPGLIFPECKFDRDPTTRLSGTMNNLCKRVFGHTIGASRFHDTYALRAVRAGLDIEALRKLIGVKSLQHAAKFIPPATPESVRGFVDSIPVVV